MMGRQTVDQSQLFYLFNLEEHIPADHLLRRLNPIVTRVLVDLREKLAAFYSDIGRPSIDPELMIRMLIVGYCYGIRFERKLCEEVKLHLGYRWFCRLELDDKVPDHSTFSVNRHGRFRDSDIFRQMFEAVVRACMDAGLVKGEGFAVDASVMEADASRYHGRAPDEIDWSAPERQTRAVAEFLRALDDEDAGADRKPPKVISPVDPCSAWTAKANKRVQFGYGLNYLIDIKYAVIVDVEATPARTYDEVAATKTMIKRTEQRLGLKPERLAADTAYGTGKFLHWVIGTGITPHIPVWDMSNAKKASCRAPTSPSIGSATSTSALRVSFSGQPPGAQRFSRLRQSNVDAVYERHVCLHRCREAPLSPGSDGVPDIRAPASSLGTAPGGP
jgi:transposase